MNSVRRADPAQAVRFCFCLFLTNNGELARGSLWSQPNNEKQCSKQLQCEVPCSIGNVVNSSLFINCSFLFCPPPVMLSMEGGSAGGGVWPGGSMGGGRGHFGPAAMYCTTTWCFALKGLRTINVRPHETLQEERGSTRFVQSFFPTNDKGVISDTAWTPCLQLSGVQRQTSRSKRQASGHPRIAVLCLKRKSLPRFIQTLKHLSILSLHSNDEGSSFSKQRKKLVKGGGILRAKYLLL